MKALCIFLSMNVFSYFKQLTDSKFGFPEMLSLFILSVALGAIVFLVRKHANVNDVHETLECIPEGTIGNRNLYTLRVRKPGSKREKIWRRVCFAPFLDKKLRNYFRYHEIGVPEGTLVIKEGKAQNGKDTIVKVKLTKDTQFLKVEHRSKAA